MEYKSEAWSRVRVMFEAPILDERKWAKTPDIPADAFIIDLEDSVPLADKDRAREKAVTFIKDPSFFDGRLTVPRCNELKTPWGKDDVIAFAEAGASIIMVPMCESADDVLEVLELARAHGADPKILATIESAGGVINCGEIFKVPEVIVAGFGSGDLHVSAGYPLREPDGSLNRALEYAKSKAALAGRAYGVPVLGIAFQHNLKDLDEVRATAKVEKLYGFTGLTCFYPPQVPVLLEVMSPSKEEIDEANEIVTVYEAAVAAGNPAVQLPNGKAVLVHAYKEAKDVLAHVR